MTVQCPYCGAAAPLVTGADVYPHRRDLHEIFLYRCTPCDAWVGCHRGTTRPLGRLANAELRRAKQAAHAAFDPLWRHRAGIRTARMPRAKAYAWLARELGIEAADCHIGMFDVATCRRVVEVCARHHEQARNSLPGAPSS